MEDEIEQIELVGHAEPIEPIHIREIHLDTDEVDGRLHGVPTHEPPPPFTDDSLTTELNKVVEVELANISTYDQFEDVLLYSARVRDNPSNRSIIIQIGRELIKEFRSLGGKGVKLICKPFKHNTNAMYWTYIGDFNKYEVLECNIGGTNQSHTWYKVKLKDSDLPIVCVDKNNRFIFKPGDSIFTKMSDDAIPEVIGCSNTEITHFKPLPVGNPSIDEVEGALGRVAFLNDDGYYMDEQGGEVTNEEQYGYDDDEEE